MTCMHVWMSQWVLYISQCFIHLLALVFTYNINMIVFSVFSCRARQKPTTKETAMPGESKASRPLRVVLKRGTSLILCPPPPPRPRQEPLTASLANRVRQPKLTPITGTKNRRSAYLSFVAEIIIAMQDCRGLSVLLENENKNMQK